MKIAVMLGCLAVISGCASMVPPDQMPITDEKREFTFDYAVPGKSQHELYRSARNYLATAYRDSRAVTRVEDETDGTIIGKGIAPWNFTTDSMLLPFIPCGSNYDVIFIAKEGRARLQLTLREGVTQPATCGWALPPKRDYPQIVQQFNDMSTGLEKALNGQGAVDQLRNF
ncbi:DUF4468 domain-containing protein [Telluria sp. B2]